MKEVKIKLYTIKELKEVNPTAFDKVLDGLKDNLIENNFYFAEEDAREVLKNTYGLKRSIKKVFYSISYSQGDGFCFTAHNILNYFNLSKRENLNAFEKYLIDNLKNDELEKIIYYLNCDYNLSIKKRSFNYAHAYTCFIDYEAFYSSDEPKELDEMDELLNKVCSMLFNNVYVKICEHIEKILYSYYEVSDGDAIENAEDNGYYYTKDGELFAE